MLAFHAIKPPPVLFSRRAMLTGAAASFAPTGSFIGGTCPLAAYSNPCSRYAGYIERLRLHLINRAIHEGWVEERHSPTFGGLSRRNAEGALTCARMRGRVIDTRIAEDK